MLSKKVVKEDFGKSKYSNRDMNKIRALFDITKEKDYTIDDITWNDLEMDKVFKQIDRTYSTAGEGVLYSMLRNPIVDKDELNKRSELIDYFINNQDLTTDIRRILFNLGYDRKNRVLDMFNGLLTINKCKYYLYFIMGIVIPIILALSAVIFKEPRIMFFFMVTCLINMGIEMTERSTIQASTLGYLRSLINAGKKLYKINDSKIDKYTGAISNVLEEISDINKGTLVISISNAWGGVLELISIPFLIEVSTYYRISGRIEEKKYDIYKLLYYVGELDALISIASYKFSNKEKLCTPKFQDNKEIEIVEGINPLLKNPVPNTIKINSKGIVLTGTNMSGKSTFLRMIGVNILFSQVFNFAFAKEYNSCVFNIVSSISPNDDIEKGKSYYLSEAESLLRIIRSLEKDLPVFALIDEIFRGTNPVERIASSSEILSYINSRNSIVIVATHDRELTDMLKDEYEFYYFSEDVNDNEGLVFDYKIKRGISLTRNAIKLLDYIGYPKEIIEKSYDRCKKLDGYI